MNGKEPGRGADPGGMVNPRSIPRPDRIVAAVITRKPIPRFLYRKGLG